MPKSKWGIRTALKKIPKRKAAVFLQLASGHTLIETHLPYETFPGVSEPPENGVF
jgi:hypothetical protein